MGLKKFNAKKEIKKLKRRNSKLKKIGIIGILIGTIFIISSYALYSYTGSSLAFDSKVSKKIKTEIEVINGEAEEKIKEGDYKEEQTFKIKPLSEEYEYKSTICTDNAKGRYDATTNILTISNATNIKTKCTINFGCKLKTGETKTILGKEYEVLASCNQDFTKGFPNADTSEEESERLSGLYKAEDDEGESYYFRGAVENNYVQFGKGKTRNNQEEHDLMWRIVRINGDGSVRLILDENVSISNFNINATEPFYKYVGYTYDNTSPCTRDNPCISNYNRILKDFTKSNNWTNSTVKYVLEEWYKNNLFNYDKNIILGYFCNDTSYGGGMEETTNTSDFLYYGANKRIRNNHSPDFHCPDPKNKTGNLRKYGGVYRLKIGLISADELYYGGYDYNSTTSNYASEKNYLRRNFHYNSLSPSQGNYFNAHMFYANFTGAIYSPDVGMVASYENSPVINLKPDVKVTGEGTKEKPYQVIEN